MTQVVLKSSTTARGVLSVMIDLDTTKVTWSAKNWATIVRCTSTPMLLSAKAQEMYVFCVFRMMYIRMYVHTYACMYSSLCG